MKLSLAKNKTGVLKLGKKKKKKNKLQAVTPANDIPAENINELRYKRAAQAFSKLGMIYSLSFGSLPGEKKLDETQMTQVATTLDAAEDAVRASLKLFPEHEAIKAMNAAKSQATTLFQLLTKNWPQDGQRLFVADLGLGEALELSDEDAARLTGEQQAKFHEEMQVAIDNYHAKVEELINNYDAIKQKAKEKLKKNYVEEHYPAPDRLRARLQAKLTCCGGVSKCMDFAHVPEKWRVKLEEQADAQIQEAVKSVEATLVVGFHAALVKLHESLKGAQSGQKRCFRTAGFENIYEHFQVLQNDIRRFGLLQNTKISEQVAATIKALGLADASPKDAAEMMRHSDSLKNRAIMQLDAIVSTVTELVKTGNATAPVRIVSTKDAT